MATQIFYMFTPNDRIWRAYRGWEKPPTRLYHTHIVWELEYRENCRSCWCFSWTVCTRMWIGNHRKPSTTCSRNQSWLGLRHSWQTSLPQANIARENRPSQKERFIFQPSNSGCHLSESKLESSPSRVENIKSLKLGGGNSNIVYFHPENWGYDPIGRAYFSNGLVQPPTSEPPPRISLEKNILQWNVSLPTSTNKREDLSMFRSQKAMINGVRFGYRILIQGTNEPYMYLLNTIKMKQM